MLMYLEERANALKAADFNKATEIELEMTAYKDKNFNEIIIPNLAYCTFMNHEAF